MRNFIVATMLLNSVLIGQAHGAKSGDSTVEVIQSTQLSAGPLRASITLRYPTLLRGEFQSAFDKAASGAILELLQSRTRRFAVQFVAGGNDLLNLDRDEIPPSNNDYIWEVVEYEISLLSNECMSIVFVYNELTGGSGGNSLHAVLNLVGDQENGARTLDLEELFSDNSEYWEIITHYCMTNLRSQDAAWVIAGSVTDIGPQAKSRWTISQSGLTFYFDPYEVHAGGFGPFRVKIPFSALSDVLKPGMPDALFDGK